MLREKWMHRRSHCKITEMEIKNEKNTKSGATTRGKNSKECTSNSVIVKEESSNNPIMATENNPARKPSTSRRRYNSVASTKTAVRSPRRRNTKTNVNTSGGSKMPVKGKKRIYKRKLKKDAKTASKKRLKPTQRERKNKASLNNPVPVVNSALKKAAVIRQINAKKTCRRNKSKTLKKVHKGRPALKKEDKKKSSVRTRKKKFKIDPPPVRGWNSSNQGLFQKWKPFKSSWKLFGQSECKVFMLLLNRWIQFRIHDASSSSKDRNKHWNVLNRFHGCTMDGLKGSFLFAGSTVQCLAWCPVPPTNKEEQFLALTTEFPSSSAKATKQGLVQIWTLSKTNDKPQLGLAIVHNYGRISAMTWCPSGTYQDATTSDASKYVLPRLGLLALACKDGNIRIHSIPHPRFLAYDSSLIPLYTKNPDVILSPNYRSTDLAQCTAASWLNAGVCNRIAGGYSDGLIRLFDLNCDFTTINAFSTFIAHKAAVLSIAFAPFPGGQWLASSSIDKTIKFWDTIDITALSIINKRGSAYKLHWIPQSTTVLANAQRLEGYLTVQCISQWPKQAFQVVGQDCAASKGSDFSENLRFLVIGNLNGEVGVYSIRTSTDLSKPVPMHIYRTRLEDISSPILKMENKPIKKDSSRKMGSSETKYGLVFEDMNVEGNIYTKEKLKKLNLLYKSANCAMDYDSASITEVAWNPNIDWLTCVAIAGHSGLCRILNLSGLES